MSWLSRLFESRDAGVQPAGTLERPSVSLYQALAGIPVDAGVTVNASTAMSVPEVFASVRAIAQDVARCPVKLQTRQADGDWVDAYDHPLWTLLADLPNPETTSVSFRDQMQRDLLQYEAAYAEVERDRQGQVKGLWRLEPDRMHSDRDSLGRKQWHYPGVPVYRFDANRPPIFELLHPSPIYACKNLIGLALALDKYTSTYFKNGARFSGSLSTPKGLGEKAIKNLRESISALYSGAENAHKLLILEEDLKYIPIGAQNDQAQLNEIRRLVQVMICGTLRMPPHKIGNLERATFSNIEQQDREYVGSTLDVFFVLWEQAARRDLLTDRQYPRYRMAFDREALVQADFKTRMDALAVGLNAGVWSANDARRKLRENPIPADAGGNAYYHNGNLIPLATSIATTVTGAGLSDPGGVTA